MKLIPKARPVRIRIMSGGMEHSNLKSLKDHFSIKDVMESISNDSMDRWLEQCGENERAKSVKAASEKGAIEIMKVFFPELEMKSNVDIVIHLYKSGQKDDAIYLFDKYLSDEDKDYFFPLFKKHWEKDADIAFIYAKERAKDIDDFKSFNVTKDILESAIRRGNRQAKEYKESDFWKDREYRFSVSNSEVNIQKMKNVVLNIFDGNGVSLKKLNNKEKNIVKFAEFCKEISRKIMRYSYNESIMWDVVQFRESQEKINNPLIPEIKLLQVMLNECHQKDGWKLLRSIEPETPVIKLYKKQYYILRNKSLRENYRFVLEHLFDEHQ